MPTPQELAEVEALFQCFLPGAAQLLEARILRSLRRASGSFLCRSLLRGSHVVCANELVDARVFCFLIDRIAFSAAEVVLRLLTSHCRVPKSAINRAAFLGGHQCVSQSMTYSNTMTRELEFPDSCPAQWGERCRGVQGLGKPAKAPSHTDASLNNTSNASSSGALPRYYAVFIA